MSNNEFGEFDSDPHTRWLRDGRNMVLTMPFKYTGPKPHRLQWYVPVGTTINGASIPQLLWSVVGSPFCGKYRNASVVHDHYCESRERSWQLTHRMFYEACRCGKVPEFEAKKLYAAVWHGGPRWGEGVSLRADSVVGIVDRFVRGKLPNLRPSLKEIEGWS